MGTSLIAPEGVNGTIAGEKEAVDKLVKDLFKKIGAE